MRKKIIGPTLSAMLFALCVSVDAQETGKIPRVGVLISASPSAAASRVKAFHLGLHELGHVEGKNIIIDYRYAEGKPDTLPALEASKLFGKVLDVDQRLAGHGRESLTKREWLCFWGRVPPRCEQITAKADVFGPTIQTARPPTRAAAVRNPAVATKYHHFEAARPATIPQRTAAGPERTIAAR